MYERKAASARRCARVKSAIGLSLQALGIERVISIGKCEQERNCESLSERTGERGGRREEKRERATGSVAFAGSWVIPTAHNLANVFPLFFSLSFSLSLSLSISYPFFTFIVKNLTYELEHTSQISEHDDHSGNAQTLSAKLTEVKKGLLPKCAPIRPAGLCLYILT